VGGLDRALAEIEGKVAGLKVARANFSEPPVSDDDLDSVYSEISDNDFYDEICDPEGEVEREEVLEAEFAEAESKAPGGKSKQAARARLLNQRRKVAEARARVSARKTALKRRLTKRRAERKPKGKIKSSRPKRRVESFVSSAASGSDGLYPGAGAGASSVSMNGLEKYSTVMMNPWVDSSFFTRYPDEVITPTAMAGFFANRTYTMTSSSTAPIKSFFLRTRLQTYSEDLPVTDLGEAITIQNGATLAALHGVYRYTPGCIAALDMFAPTPASAVSTISPIGISPAPNQVAWGDDYGSELARWLPLQAAYRTTACAVRVRVIGLPTNTFLSPGKIYFLQLKWRADEVPMSEQDLVDLERLGRGSHVSLDQVRENGSKTLFYVPDSPDKFRMSSATLPAPGVFLETTNTGAQVLGKKVFPWMRDVLTDYVNTAPARWVVPYDPNATYGGSSSSTSETYDLQNAADEEAILAIYYVGSQDGVVLEVDYAHVVEFIPTTEAAGIITTDICLPNSQARDAILTASGMAARLRPSIIQSPVDTTSVVPTAERSFGRGTAERTLRPEAARVPMAVARAARVSAESFWDFDWLKDPIKNIGAAVKGVKGLAHEIF